MSEQLTQEVKIRVAFLEARGGDLLLATLNLSSIFLSSIFLGFTLLTSHCEAQSKNDQFAEERAEATDYFRKRVSPFIKAYCIDCHQNRRPTEAGVNFSPALNNPGHAAFSQLWKKAVARVKAHDMPPEDYDQPTVKERKVFLEWAGKVKYLSEQDPGPFVIRRLTKTEFGKTLHDLFGVDPDVADELPAEVSGEGYLNSLSPLQMEKYLAISEKVLDSVFSQEPKNPTAFQKKWIGDPHDSEAENRKSARRIARKMARLAYRRPPTSEELDVLLKVYELGRNNEIDFLPSVRLMLKAILVSPQFLFITPAAEAGNRNDIVPLDDYQLASRLSYLIWETMPDSKLMDLADKGKLRDPKVLADQARRLLMDPRSRSLFDGFGAHWLGIGDLNHRHFDPKKYPQMTPKLRLAMYDEVRLLFANIIRENKKVSELLDSNYTFLNEELAGIYGLKDRIAGTQMQRVALTNVNRGGILTMPAVLASTSFPERTSPVKRGVWVLEKVLGEQVPSAPPDVPELTEQDKKQVANLTLRERTELHRTNAVCANCHKLLDPIGFGLENFDAIGRWRDNDESGKVIDASGVLPGKAAGVERFSGFGELKAIISKREKEFARNIVERLLAYALCRQLEGYDEIVVDSLMLEIEKDGFRMQDIVRAVVTSYPFTHRRIQSTRKSR